VRVKNLKDLAIVEQSHLDLVDAIIRDKKYAMAGDFARKLVLWNEGGVYLDFD
jgi:mannosyltransferase OCH1-like enzyme